MQMSKRFIWITKSFMCNVTLTLHNLRYTITLDFLWLFDARSSTLILVFYLLQVIQEEGKHEDQCTELVADPAFPRWDCTNLKGWVPTFYFCQYSQTTWKWNILDRMGWGASVLSAFGSRIGYPHQDWMGVPPSVGYSTPSLRLDWGTPSGRMGYSPVGKDGETPPLGRIWVPPSTRWGNPSHGVER